MVKEKFCLAACRHADPSAVFVFQAASTLITASTSTVNLINGANPCNVFWQVGSSATLGTNSVFVGTVLALTSVAATTGATVQGRLLARNGAVTLDNNVITGSNCASSTTATTAVPTTTPASGATTTVTPTTDLPETGGSTGVTAAVGLLAVGIGIALVLLAARRSTPSTTRRG